MLFWDDTFPRKPLCILGMVGAGKSTLIDYYLRCYCPTKGNRQADFDKKLVLHFDARTIRDNTDFYHRFFLFLQSEMRTKCLERGFDLDDAVRRRPTQPQNVRQWVHAALEELTRVPPKSPAAAFVPSSPFPYIVLVVDNLDQSSIDVQIRAITEVEQWLRTPSIRLSPGHPADVAQHVPQAPEPPVQPAPRRPGLRDRPDRHPRPHGQPRARHGRIPPAPVVPGLGEGRRVHRPDDAAGPGAPPAADQGAGPREPAADARALGVVPLRRHGVSASGSSSGRTRSRAAPSITSCSTRSSSAPTTPSTTTSTASPTSSRWGPAGSGRGTS